MPAWTGGHHTSVMPGTPARSSTDHAVAARMIEEHTAFSEKLPGSEPSIVPRRIGSLRWVMQVTRMAGLGGRFKIAASPASGTRARMAVPTHVGDEEP